MNIKLQLIANSVSETLIDNIDADKIADTKAINLLLQIQEIIKDHTLADFDAIDKIVILLNQNGFDTGGQNYWQKKMVSRLIIFFKKQVCPTYRVNLFLILLYNKSIFVRIDRNVGVRQNFL